jgi:hypothetical protein
MVHKKDCVEDSRLQRMLLSFWFEFQFENLNFGGSAKEFKKNSKESR